jgi:hypothetical protein
VGTLHSTSRAQEYCKSKQPLASRHEQGSEDKTINDSMISFVVGYYNSNRGVGK